MFGNIFVHVQGNLLFFDCFEVFQGVFFSHFSAVSDGFVDVFWSFFWAV